MNFLVLVLIDTEFQADVSILPPKSGLPPPQIYDPCLFNRLIFLSECIRDVLGSTRVVGTTREARLGLSLQSYYSR